VVWALVLEELGQEWVEDWAEDAVCLPPVALAEGGAHVRISEFPREKLLLRMKKHI